jgi:hypothetical protein
MKRSLITPVKILALVWLVLALTIVLQLVGCGGVPDMRDVPTVATEPEIGSATTAPVFTVDERSALLGRLAALDAGERARAAAVKKEAAEAAERPLRSLLTWGIWAGGALSIVGTLAMGLCFSPWGSWIPGGKGTAAAAIGTGLSVIFLAKSIVTALAYVWVLWVVLGIGVFGILVWVGVLAIRATARHADRVAGEMTPEGVILATEASVDDQMKSGVRWLINAARGKFK